MDGWGQLRRLSLRLKVRVGSWSQRGGLGLFHRSKTTATNITLLETPTCHPDCKIERVNRRELSATGYDLIEPAAVQS